MALNSRSSTELFDDTKKILHGPQNLRVELDKSQVIPDDPGAGTPAMVYLYEPFASRATACATYACACGEGELQPCYLHGDVIQLTDAQRTWLASIDDEIGNFLGW